MTGYVVHYTTGTFVGTKNESSSSTSTDITDLISAATYTISVEATSQHLSGESEEKTLTLCEYDINLVESSAIAFICTHTYIHTLTNIYI